MTLQARLFFVGFLMTTQLAWAQRGRWETGGFVGLAGYLGDLNKSDWLSKEPRIALGATVRYNVAPLWAVRLSYLHGRFSGRDSHYADRAFRNFATTSPANEITSQVEFHLWPLTDSRNPRAFKASFTPYLLVGLGLVITNPKPDFENMIVVKPEFAEGAEIDRNAKYANTHAVVPFGLGIKYRFAPQWTLAAEVGFRLTFSDYLDGISFAANPNTNDRYKFSGLTLSYRFNKSATKCMLYY